MQLETDRLILRPFQSEDLNAYAEICADPQVMRYFARPYTFREVENFLQQYATKWETGGYAFSAIIRKSDGLLLGSCGLSWIENEMIFTPCTEIGWRLRPDVWGRGYATEAAREWLKWGFEQRELKEIYAFTPVLNRPSQQVMQRLRMQRVPELYFDLPGLDEDHPLRPMILSRMTQKDWAKIMESKENFRSDAELKTLPFTL